MQKLSSNCPCDACARAMLVGSPSMAAPRGLYLYKSAHLPNWKTEANCEPDGPRPADLSPLARSKHTHTRARISPTSIGRSVLGRGYCATQHSGGNTAHSLEPVSARVRIRTCVTLCALPSVCCTGSTPALPLTPHTFVRLTDKWPTTTDLSTFGILGWTLLSSRDSFVP